MLVAPRTARRVGVILLLAGRDRGGLSTLVVATVSGNAPFPSPFPFPFLLPAVALQKSQVLKVKGFGPFLPKSNSYTYPPVPWDLLPCDNIGYIYKLNK